MYCTCYKAGAMRHGHLPCRATRGHFTTWRCNHHPSIFSGLPSDLGKNGTRCLTNMHSPGFVVGMLNSVILRGCRHVPRFNSASSATNVTLQSFITLYATANIWTLPVTSCAMLARSTRTCASLRCTLQTRSTHRQLILQPLSPDWQQFHRKNTMHVMLLLSLWPWANAW